MRLPDVTNNIDPHAYLERINYSSGLDLDAPETSLTLFRTLHEAQLQAVPFEHLSIHYGHPITVTVARKMASSDTISVRKLKSSRSSQTVNQET